MFFLLKEREQMSDLHSGLIPRQMFDGLRQWWRNWRAAGSGLTELACCGEFEVERMARYLGMPSSELRKIVKPRSRRCRSSAAAHG